LHAALDEVIVGVNDSDIRRNLEGPFWGKLLCATPYFIKYGVMGMGKADHQGVLSVERKKSKRLEKEVKRLQKLLAQYQT
jgi:hypothetical protein